MPDSDPMAPGEIARGFLDLKAEIRDLKRGFVGRREYDADQRTADHRFVAVERDVKDIETAVGAIAEREDDRRSLRTQVYVGPIISGIVVGVVVAVMLAVIGLR